MIRVTLCSWWWTGGWGTEESGRQPISLHNASSRTAISRNISHLLSFPNLSFNYIPLLFRKILDISLKYSIVSSQLIKWLRQTLSGEHFELKGKSLGLGKSIKWVLIQWLVFTIKPLQLITDIEILVKVNFFFLRFIHSDWRTLYFCKSRKYNLEPLCTLPLIFSLKNTSGDWEWGNHYEASISAISPSSNPRVHLSLDFWKT